MIGSKEPSWLATIVYILLVTVIACAIYKYDYHDKDEPVCIAGWQLAGKDNDCSK